MRCSWGLGLCHRFPLRSFITAEDAHSANPIAGFSYRGLSLLKSESGSEHRRFQNLEVLLSFLVGSPGPLCCFPIRPISLLFGFVTATWAVWLLTSYFTSLLVVVRKKKKERNMHKPVPLAPSWALRMPIDKTSVAEMPHC